MIYRLVNILSIISNQPKSSFSYKDFSKPAKRKIRKDWSCGDLYYSTWPDITELTPSQVNNALSSLSNYGAMNEDDKMYLNELVPSIFDYTIHG